MNLKKTNPMNEYAIKWIPAVEGSYPKYGSKVLLLTKDETIFDGALYRWKNKDGSEYDQWEPIGYKFEDVTHWAFLYKTPHFTEDYEKYYVEQGEEQ